MIEPYIGEIRIFGITYAPKGWLLCHGQLISIEKYKPLFTLLLYQFGGDKEKELFALPNLRGRVPMGLGQGPGLSPRTLGEQLGTERNHNVGVHTHTLNNLSGKLMASDKTANQSTPAEKTLAVSSANIYSDNEPDIEMHKISIEISGDIETSGESKVNNIQPSLSLNYCICYDGIYPSRK